MENEVYLYPYSAADAKARDELNLWRDSFRANVTCAKDMKESIARHYHDDCLNDECVSEMLEKYGFKRVSFVLANTIQVKHYDGRFSPRNKSWAKQIFIPEDKDHNFEFVCEAHPGLVDMFAKNVREAYYDLRLIGAEFCEADDSDQDYEGKVIVLSPDVLKEDCWCQQNQLWLCTGGFGSHPHSRGSAVFATCLSDGEKTRWDRSDFMGVLKDEYVPDWAKEKLAELKKEQEPAMGGMSM